MMKKQNNNIKLVIFWVISFICIIFMMSLRAFASEPYFPMQQNVNEIFTEIDKTNIDNSFDSENNYVFVRLNHTASRGRKYCDVLYFPKNSDVMIYGEINNNGYQFSIFKYGSANVYYRSILLQDNEISLQGTVGNNYFTDFQNNNSNLYSNTVDYISNFKLYNTNNEQTRTIVLNYNDGNTNPINIGVAVIPPEPIVPEYLTGDTAPTNVPPSYTINNYIWSTAPSFDGSSVINGIQSIKDTLEWLADNIKNSISNLLNNLKGLAEYIGKTIQYYGNVIIQTINNAIQNFYDNMVALIEPIVSDLNELKQNFLDFADLFIHPFDEEEFEQQIDNCQLITQYEELLDNSDILREVLANAVERDTFVLYIDFENPFAASEHKIIHGQISFNWLVPLRPFYRPFLTVFTLLECFLGGFRLLGNIIGGKAK